MDRSAASEKLHPKSERKQCGSNILVAPPCFHPSGNIASNLSEKHSTHFPIHPGGIIIPLQPTLKRQINEVAHYFSFPSAMGLSLHANVSIHGSLQSSRLAGDGGDLPLPLITAASWNSLFFDFKEHDGVPKFQSAWMDPSRPSGVGVLGRLEFRIDYNIASWYEAWLMATLSRKAPGPGDVDESLEEIHRRSETDSSSSSEFSQSTAPTSLNTSPVQLGLIKISSTLDRLQPSLTPRDGSPRAIRSRSIHLLSQARQYRSHRPAESQWMSKNSLLSVCSNRNPSQDFDLFISPPTSETHSILIETPSRKSVPRIEYQDHEMPSEQTTPPSGTFMDEISSEDSDSFCGVIDKVVKMTRENHSVDLVSNPNTSNHNSESETDEQGKSAMVETVASKETSIELQSAPVSPTKLAVEASPGKTVEKCDKRSSGVNIISDWKKFLSNMSPPSSSNSAIAERDHNGYKHLGNRPRRIPQRLNLCPVNETSDRLPVISPPSSISPPVAPTFKTSKIQESLDAELKKTQKKHRNSEVYTENTGVSDPRSPRAFLNSLPPPAIWSLASRNKKPWALSKMVDNIRSDSVKKRPIYRDDAMRSGLYSANDLLSHNNSFASLDQAGKSPGSSRHPDRKESPLPRPSFPKGTSYSSDSISRLPVVASGSNVGDPGARQEVLVRVFSQCKKGSSESKRLSKMMMDLDSDKAHHGARAPSQWPQKATCFQSLLPLSLSRNSSVSSLQPVIHKAKKVDITNNSTSRLTILKPPA
ncbi:hypothetical protein PtB15_17B306 [Puccinia triticina]|nr:hypothetical protein PtB15_17B306 [Puccinia triticina]